MAKDLVKEKEFEDFLARVANLMNSDDDLDSLNKYLPDYLGEEVGGFTSASDVLRYLQKRKLLTYTNLKPLKDILYIFKRHDLIQEATQYHRSCMHGTIDLLNTEMQTETDSSKESVCFYLENIVHWRVLMHLLLEKLSDLVFVPVSEIKITHPYTDVHEGSFVWKVFMDKVFTEELQRVLTDKDSTACLGIYGIVKVVVADYTYDINDVMVPLEKPQRCQNFTVELEQRNEEYIRRLCSLEVGLGTLQQLVKELGDPDEHLQKLTRLHKFSGMSTTLWKTLGKMPHQKLPAKSTPVFSQDELRMSCLYSKARFARMNTQFLHNPKNIKNSKLSKENDEASSVTQDD